MLLYPTVWVLITIGWTQAADKHVKDLRDTCEDIYGLPPSERRDCQPWPMPDPGEAQQLCASRGCVWCEPGVNDGTPWCFADDNKCPSTIPPASRQDCHPEPNMTPESCNQRGCIFCRDDSNTGVPWCFYDEDVSQGGEMCPAYIPAGERIDCWPHSAIAASKETCLSRHCYWCSDDSVPADTPWCFTPPTQGYNIVGQVADTTKGYRVDIERKEYPTWFGGDIDTARVEAEYHTNTRLRLKFFDPNSPRWEVPLYIDSPDSKAASPLYAVTFGNEPAFHFIISRSSTGEVLFNSSIGGLVLADQAMQVACKLPTDNVYGVGENMHRSYKHNMNWKEWGMWARDTPVIDNANLYGVHPFFMGLDSQNNAFGVLILNSNAQEFKFTPAPGFIYRTNGGILDMYFFFGPTPEAVVSQYTLAVGRPVMPPYWGLGFQLARYGYNSLTNMRNVISTMRDYDIPHDVQYCDIDCMFKNLDFTYDQTTYAGLPEYVHQLKSEGTRFIIILDPCIASSLPSGISSYPPLDSGNAAGVWVRDDVGGYALGTVWPYDQVQMSGDVSVYFPDYSLAATTTWWTNECVAFHDVLDFDGLWIDMNEPANFNDGSTSGCNLNHINNPIFSPRAVMDYKELYKKTTCLDYTMDMGLMYNTHSLYGWSEAEPSLIAAQAATGGKRSIVVSRSTYPGAQKFVGHWLGDNSATWDDLKLSIIGCLEFNIFGQPYVGPDICGFSGNSNEALCERWQELGAFYTFSRNHNGINWDDHHPSFWPSVGTTSAIVLRIRYKLLPYLYTLFYHAHTTGGTVMRPLMHEFRHDARTHSIDEQFLWGSGLLITPVLTEDALTVEGYFPAARWYDWYTHAEQAGVPGDVLLAAPRNHIPLHVRGGVIFPLQDPSNSTMWSRSNPMKLLVALDHLDSASGDLYWDEGDDAGAPENGNYFLGNYYVSQGVLTALVDHNNYPLMGSLHFDQVVICGEIRIINDVHVEGQLHLPLYWNYDSNKKVLTIDSLDITVNTEFIITWSP